MFSGLHRSLKLDCRIVDPSCSSSGPSDKHFSAEIYCRTTTGHNGYLQKAAGGCHGLQTTARQAGRLPLVNWFFIVRFNFLEKKVNWMKQNTNCSISMSITKVEEIKDHLLIFLNRRGSKHENITSSLELNLLRSYKIRCAEKNCNLYQMMIDKVSQKLS